MNLYERLRLMPVKPGRSVEAFSALIRRPAIAPQQARDVLTAFGLRLLSAPSNLSTGWRNHLVVVNTDDGPKVLKRHADRWRAETVVHEHSILNHLAGKGFPAPHPLTLQDGDTIWQDEFGHWSVFDYVRGLNATGRYLSDQVLGDLLREAGNTLAAYHRIVDDVVLGGHHHLDVDLDDLDRRLDVLKQQTRPDLAPLLDKATHLSERLGQLGAQLADAPLKRLVVHGDYGLHNLLFQRDGQVFVHDFELSHLNWRLVDVAAASSRIGVRWRHVFADSYRQSSGIDDGEWRFLPQVWEFHRLSGAIRSWENYLQYGDQRRLEKAKRRIVEAEDVANHGPGGLNGVARESANGSASVDEVASPRVVMVVRLFHPWVGGTERQAQKLAKKLTEDGIDVQISTGRWFRGTKSWEAIDGVPVFRNSTLWEFFGLRGFRKFGGYLYMLTLLWHLWRRRNTYDIIHVHGLNYHTAIAVIAGRLLHRPVIVKLANSGPASDIDRMRQGRQLALSRFLLPTALRSDRFVALNPAVIGELMDAGVGRDRIVEIPNGVETTSLEPTRTAGTIRVTYIGRLHHQKGLDTLLRAAAIVKQQSPSLQFDLTLVGDGPARAGLKKLAEGLGVPVRFTGTTVDVAGELATAAVFVLPSQAEGLSNSLLEAMATKHAVVVSAIPGNLAVVTDGHNGLVFTPGNEQELATVLQRLLVDDQLRETLGANAVATVDRLYRLDVVAARYRNLYLELLAHDRELVSA